MERKPLTWTNFSGVLGLLLLFSVLGGALTVKLAWFIATVATIPIVALSMYVMWLKYGDNRVRVNELYSFVMLLMMTIYCYIPLFSIIWNSWVGAVTLLLYVLLFAIFYRYREPFCRMLNNRDANGKKKDSPFMTWWLAGVGLLGIASFIFILATVPFPPHEAEINLVIIFMYSISFVFFTISPLNLVHPEQLIEWKILHRKDYK